MPSPTSDLLLEAPEVLDYDNPGVTADTRLRVGYPRLTKQGATESDATIARRVTSEIDAVHLPAYDEHDNAIRPSDDDPLVNVKRALSFKPATGVNFTTGATFNTYLKNNFETRVADGAVQFHAVDQSFVPDPDNAPDVIKPALSYLHIGKADQPLTDVNGVELPRRYNQLTDQKQKTGIGLFSDGELNAWARQPINLCSSEAINLTTQGYCLSTYGESVISTYEILNKADIERINSGEITDKGVDRKIINLNALRSTDLGWYRQIFDRGRALNFSTANKGDFSISSSYSLGIGAKFEHSVAASLGTSFSGKVELNRGFGIDIGIGGAMFKHPSGSWTFESDAELCGTSSVKLTIAGVDTLPIKGNLEIYSKVLTAAVVVQTAAFTGFNAYLAERADRTLTAADAENKGDDTHNLVTALDDGMKVYEAALALSAITCAAGIVMGAAQAIWTALRIPDPLAPNIELSRTFIALRCGTNGIEISPTGIKIVSLAGSVDIGGMTLNLGAPSINHTPVPPIPVAPMLP